MGVERQAEFFCIEQLWILCCMNHIAENYPAYVTGPLGTKPSGYKEPVKTKCGKCGRTLEFRESKYSYGPAMGWLGAFIHDQGEVR